MTNIEKLIEIAEVNFHENYYFEETKAGYANAYAAYELAYVAKHQFDDLSTMIDTVNNQRYQAIKDWTSYAATELKHTILSIFHPLKNQLELSIGEDELRKRLEGTEDYLQWARGRINN